MNNFYFAELGSIKKDKNYYYEYKKHIFIKKIEYEDSYYGLDVLSNQIYPYYQNGDIPVNQDTIVRELPVNLYFTDKYFDEKTPENALNDVKKVIHWLKYMHDFQRQMGETDIHIFNINNFLTLINLVRINSANKKIILYAFQEGLKWWSNAEKDLLSQLHIAIEKDNLDKIFAIDRKLDILSQNFRKSVEELNNKLSEKEFGKYI